MSKRGYPSKAAFSWTTVHAEWRGQFPLTSLTWQLPSASPIFRLPKGFGELFLRFPHQLWAIRAFGVCTAVFKDKSQNSIESIGFQITVTFVNLWSNHHEILTDIVWRFVFLKIIWISVDGATYVSNHELFSRRNIAIFKYLHINQYKGGY